MGANVDKAEFLVPLEEVEVKITFEFLESVKMFSLETSGIVSNEAALVMLAVRIKEKYKAVTRRTETMNKNSKSNLTRVWSIQEN